MTKTRFDVLGLDKIDRNDWSFFDISVNPAARVGPIYKTKIEALCDLARYARDSWGLEA